MSYRPDNGYGDPFRNPQVPPAAPGAPPGQRVGFMQPTVPYPPSQNPSTYSVNTVDDEEKGQYDFVGEEEDEVRPLNNGSLGYGR
jgi:hypothetical protein